MASIIVDNSENETPEKESNEANLVTWVMDHVEEWETYRDNNFKDSWAEYYRLWRGIWDAADKTRDSERSRLISPALQQAVEMAVSELEEATFGKGKWFDVFLNSALYGTGIGKIVVEEEENYKVTSQPVNEFSNVQEGVGEATTRISVPLISVPPSEFVIDTAATSIKEALGMAHIMDVPRHTVETKQDLGIYEDEELGGYPDDLDVSAKGESKAIEVDGKVRIVEYHGLVPRKYMPVELLYGEELVDLELDDEYEDEDEELVEAIVTIANDGVLLRAAETPYMMNDRCFVAYQYDTIPNRFWGRGIAEKGYNMQKAIDAELRARIDSMALTVHPMMAADATRLPRGFDLTVRPGKTLLTQGDPSSILMPFKFGQTDASTFSQSGDLERQLQNATGSMDAGTPTGMNARNSTASGMSMIQGGAIKRSKRTLANIERHFTTPLIHKTAWRRMQFDSTRYPVSDVKFTVYGSLGIMAREIEQQQLSSLLNTVPPDSPAYWMLIRSIYENSSISNKDQMLLLVDQLLQKTLNPEPDPMIAIKQQELQMLQKDKSMSLEIELLRAKTEEARVKIEAAKVPSEIAKDEASTVLTLAKAETETGVGVGVEEVPTVGISPVEEEFLNQLFGGNNG